MPSPRPRDPAHAAHAAHLRTEMARYGDTAPLTVANPKPAAWTPLSATAPAAGKKAKKAATSND